MNKIQFTTPWGAVIAAFVRENTNDTNTLISCLEEDEYQIARLPEGGVAVDLGAHIGGCTLALAARGFKEIIAAEMLPENIKLLEENIQANKLENITVVRAAVTGGVAFETPRSAVAYYADTDSEGGAAHEFIGTIMADKFIVDTNKHGRSIEVELVPLDKLFKLRNVKVCDFMKLDVEGAEWDIIKNTPPEVLKKVKRLAVEIESLDKKETSTGEFLKLLPKSFKDVSKEYFPKWCEPGMIVHGYFVQEGVE